MLDQKFVDAVYHLGKFVTEYQTTVLEAIITEDTACPLDSGGALPGNK